MTVQTPTTQPKIEELESIRGIAAFLVVFYHLPKWNPLLNTGLIDNGYLMVQLFFVLSGFVIYNAYSEKIESKADLLRFQFLRLGRLYPVHIIFLFVFLLIEVAKFIAESRYNLTNQDISAFQINSFSAFIKNLFLISSVLPNEPYSFNFPAWSISVEFYTYLVFGSSVMIFGRAKTALFCLITVASLALLISETTFGFTELLLCFAGFFFGCLTASLTKKLKITLPSYAPLAVFLLIVLFLLFKNEKEFDLVIYALSVALILSLVLSRDGIMKRVLNLNVLTWLGTISYSVYMSHASVIWVVNQFIRFVLKKPEIIDAEGRNVPQMSEPEALIASLVVAVAVLSLSTLIYHYVEKPFRTKSRQFAFAKL